MTVAVQHVPLVAPTITDIDRQSMHNAVELGLLEHGLREVERFEEMFAALVGCEWAVAVNSGTSALTVALHALDLFTEVGIPSWSCMALRNAVEAVALDRPGMPNPTYFDTSWDVRQAQATIAKGANVVAHMFGRDTRYRSNQPVIEDWTLSLGGCAALVGDLGVCSTHQSKMISTSRGGVIFGDDPDLYDRVRELVHYDRHTGFGYSVAMTAMQAALGVSQLAQLDTFISRRRHFASRYTDAFRAAGIECPDPDSGSVFFRYLIRVDSPARSVAGLSERGIEAGRGVYPPLHQLAGLPDDGFPGTMAAVESLLSVPVHPSISDAQADHVIESVLQVCAP